jgi:mannose-6-phosphate isomerase-like protein (cupin superfamily)
MPKLKHEHDLTSPILGTHLEVQNMNYTSTSWDELDLWPDPGFDGSHPWPSTEYLSLKSYYKALGCTHVAFSIGYLEPGESVEHHSHIAGEEIYILLEGGSQIRIGDDVLEAKPMDAFRIVPSAGRSVYNHTSDPCRWIFIGAPIGQGADSAQEAEH